MVPEEAQMSCQNSDNTVRKSTPSPKTHARGTEASTNTPIGIAGTKAARLLKIGATRSVFANRADTDARTSHKDR